jgi:hypothetical protein
MGLECRATDNRIPLDRLTRHHSIVGLIDTTSFYCWVDRYDNILLCKFIITNNILCNDII